MLYKINNNNDSSKLLFSIPVHENQEIINNQIENILNFNPNCKIIIHVNKSFKKFNKNLTKYPNVYFNSINHNYVYGKGLLFIHINNFLEAIKENIDFKYFLIISSNEMFIKEGLISYVEFFKNGLQIIEFNENINWHNFKKNIEKEEIIINLLKDLNLDKIYGGQTEGQFYEKDIFYKISEIYLKHFGTKEISFFETEEIVIQTIFNSFNINYGLPFTLQNYSNNISFNKTLINKIIENNIKIPNNYINGNLYSPHTNQDAISIFSIKRVDRNFNEIRDFLSKKGFILNKDTYQLNTYYFSNSSSLILYNDNHLYFKKNKSLKPLSFNWFGFEVEDGYYTIHFEIKLLNKITDYSKIGIKIHYPQEVIYNFFLEDIEINIWKNVSFPISINKKQNIIFIFDDYLDNLNIEFKNISILPIVNNVKENIAIILYENINDNNNYDYSINSININEMIIEPFKKMYDVYKFISIYNNKNLNNILNIYQPSNYLLQNEKNINEIFIKSTENLILFNETNKLNFKFIIYIRLDSIFKKNIINFNFYINKLNFISYYIPYINNQISNSYDFMSIPYKYINLVYNLIKNNYSDKNICHSIYSNLKNEIDSINFIYDDNYSKDIRTPLIKYLSDIGNINNNKGYLLTNKYLINIYYKNNHSKIIKNCDNSYYFLKKKTDKYEEYQWLGIYLNNFNKDKNIDKLINITVSFDIKLLKELDNNFQIGLKTHEPLKFYKEWINECKLNIFQSVELNISILEKDQYIILNFDNYLESVEFYIKDFKIIIDYN